MKTIRDRLLRRRAALLLLCLLLPVSPRPADAAPQSNDTLYFGGRRMPAQNITRKPKKRPRRRRGNLQPVMRAPLLAIELRLFKVREDGTPVETNPQGVFHTGDRLRVGVKANQRGYLTIIHQSGPDADGEILFPTSQLNDGGNHVEANREFVVPSNCPAKIVAFDCAYTVREGAGRELFTIIFSRDAIIDLPEKATTSSGTIQAQVLKELEQDTVKPRTDKSGTTSYAYLIVNENTQDNEEIVKRFGIVVGDAGAAATQTLAPDPTSSASPADPTPSPARPDTPTPERNGGSIDVEPVKPPGDWSSTVLIIIGMLGAAGVGVLLYYVFSAGRGGGR